MTRRPRQHIEPETVHHVIARFVASEWFIRSTEERRTYLHLLGEALSHSSWRCLAYAVMSNHIHLAMLAGVEPIATWSREVHGPFAEWINERRERIGPVFVRGPKSLRVRPDGVATVMGYIHQNPVRAGVVGQASESDWTSHRAYLGTAKVPEWLDVERGLALSRFSSSEELDRWLGETRLERADAHAALADPPRAYVRSRVTHIERWSDHVEGSTCASVLPERGMFVR